MTCARPRCRCARPTAAGCASRCRRSPSPHPTPRRWRPFVDIIADEVNVREVHAHRPTCRRSPATCCRWCPPALGPAPRRRDPARDPRRARRATGRPTATPSSPAGHRLEPGEFVLTMVADGDRPSHGARRRHRRGGAQRRAHPRARGRGPGPRPHPHDPAGPSRRRPGGERPHRACASSPTRGWAEVVRTHEALIAGRDARHVARGRRLGHRHAPDHRSRVVLTARPPRSATRSAADGHVIARAPIYCAVRSGPREVVARWLRRRSPRSRHRP